jgi:DNA-binding CsgD family transcriptional regulator
MSFPPHSLSPTQLARLIAIEREGSPFVAFKDHMGDLHIERLGADDRITIGRGEHNAVALHWDLEVSRTHAQLERVGADWTVVDDGLSRNGSFVNGERVVGRQRLNDGDVLRIGRTSLMFRTPRLGVASTVAADAAALVRLSEAQRRVLVALCRPLATTGGADVPASNREIAEELHLSQDGVKTHIRALFEKLGIDELPQYRKRTELAHRALELGFVTARDLRA